MAVGNEDIEREKAALPTGWGRFGKALEQLAQLASTDENLLATCVTLNPDYRHGVSAGTLLNLAHAVEEAGQATNVVVACTDRRLILVFAGLNGAPRSSTELPFAGTSIVERDKKEFTLEHAGERIRFRGAAKKPAARLLDTLAAKLGG